MTTKPPLNMLKQTKTIQRRNRDVTLWRHGNCAKKSKEPRQDNRGPTPSNSKKKQSQLLMSWMVENTKMMTHLTWVYLLWLMAAAQEEATDTTQGHRSFARGEREISRPSRANQLHQVQSGACHTPAGETMATGTQGRNSAARHIPINHVATLMLMWIQEQYTVIWKAFILKC